VQAKKTLLKESAAGIVFAHTFVDIFKFQKFMLD